MRISKIAGVFLFIFVLAGCDKILTEPTIDTTSDESMKQSSQKVRESLPESEREAFDQATQLLAFSQIDLIDLFTETATGVGDLESDILNSLHGKTASQVIAEAERIKAETARELLKNFKVIRSRFYQAEQQYIGKQPIIEITVKNGTDTAVSRAYFEGTIASPDRSVPWHKDSFNYSISGGLESGEEQNWRLAPNMFSDWGKIEAPADAVFTVTVKELDGPDGKTLYSTTDFTERDRERLSELKSKYDVQ